MCYRYAAIVFGILLALNVNAGTLGEFEGDVSNPPSSEEKDSDKDSARRGRSSSSSDDVGWLYYVFKAYWDALVFGTGNSFKRMNSDLQHDYLQPRRIGEAILPLIRYDSYYSHLNANQSSYDQRLEIGWGAFAYEYRDSKYRQIVPLESLNLVQNNFLIRLTVTDGIGANIGWGDSTLIGTGINYGRNSIIHAFIHGHRWGLEYRIVNTYFDSGATMEDVDWMLMRHMGQASMTVGYRRLAAPTQTLSGFYIGFSLRV